MDIVERKYDANTSFGRVCLAGRAVVFVSALSWVSSLFHGWRCLSLCVAGVILEFKRSKYEKGIWWMPWRIEAMKDVVGCEKPWGAANKH